VLISIHVASTMSRIAASTPSDDGRSTAEIAGQRRICINATIRAVEARALNVDRGRIPGRLENPRRRIDPRMR